MDELRPHNGPVVGGGWWCGRDHARQRPPSKASPGYQLSSSASIYPDPKYTLPAPHATRPFVAPACPSITDSQAPSFIRKIPKHGVTGQSPDQRPPQTVVVGTMAGSVDEQPKKAYNVSMRAFTVKPPFGAPDLRWR
ncbi:hypothetical protein NA56DRAFT_705500 [Hyaloscypha hepaticicola]|uniref:Uncharacterized protein n=1 Tax=Hyaloscypha hepaticicola TaxID=2082293 RepID=A0A2J6Q0S3_9HELO|nr:hypothetical protein NA56DRAFT_705500 [Hyaloscypha hepaticicola]